MHQLDEGLGKDDADHRLTPIHTLPEDLAYVLRIVGMIRGLCADLHVHCPLLHIFALHSKAGILMTEKDESTIPSPSDKKK